MLIAKCYALAFHLSDGRTVRPRGALLHDPSGKSWPRSSCLITSFKHAGRPLAAPTDEMRAWARKADNVKQGEAQLPPRGTGWRPVGQVEVVDYTRYGEHADKYTHEFKRPVRLLKRGDAYRLELGRGAVFNWRGFVVP